MSAVPWRWLGRRAYSEVHAAQHAHRKGIIAGTHPEELWLLEHDPVVTVGRRPAPGTPSAEELARHGISRHQAERGGLATYHGPGQLVLYALVDAWGRGLGVKGTVCALENGVIAWLADQGVEAGRRSGFPGVWVGGDKVCAVGLHFSRGVSMHGLALNLRTELEAFEHIVPCGITDGGVTSLERLVGRAPSPEEAAPSVAARVGAHLDPGSGCAAP